jgi:post-segregation antitoxin (ccd killing protein)
LLGFSRFFVQSRPFSKPGRAILTKLYLSSYLDDGVEMQTIKISSKVDEAVWNELKALARERHQNVSGLLTEAIREYLRRKRVRPEVLNHLDASMDQNEELGELLAR